MKLLIKRIARAAVALLVSAQLIWLILAVIGCITVVVIGWNTTETICNARSVDLINPSPNDNVLLDAMPKHKRLQLLDLWAVNCSHSTTFSYTGRTKKVVTLHLFCRYQISDAALNAPSDDHLKKWSAGAKEYNTRPKQPFEYPPWWPLSGNLLNEWATLKPLEWLIVSPANPEIAFQCFQQNKNGSMSEVLFFESTVPTLLRNSIY